MQKTVAVTCENLLDGEGSVSEGRILPTLQAEAQAGALFLQYHFSRRTPGNVYEFQI